MIVIWWNTLLNFNAFTNAWNHRFDIFYTPYTYAVFEQVW